MVEKSEYKDENFIVNPYAIRVLKGGIGFVISSTVVGLAIFFFHYIAGLTVILVGMVVLFSLMPYLTRNLHSNVLVAKDRVALLRRYAKKDYDSYREKISYSWDEVCITVFGPIRKYNKNENVYKVYFSNRYLMPEDIKSRSGKKGSFFLVVSYVRLVCITRFYNKPIRVILKKDVENDVVLYRCQCHSYYFDTLALLKEKNCQITFDNFKTISKRAVVAYAICCLENALKFYNCDKQGWNVLLSKMWTFTQLEETDTDGINNWFGLHDILPNSMVRPYDKYLRSHGKFSEDVVLEKVSKSEYELIDDAYENFHSTIGELCEGIVNLVAATTGDMFYDVAFNTLFTLQECILDVMNLNQIPLPELEPFTQYEYDLSNEEKHIFGWGQTFDGTKFSKFLCSDEPNL